jgi:small-conductance mechanosensitive channel
LNSPGTTPVAAVCVPSCAAGLALGFAFKDYASSLIAGGGAIYEQPYRPGDWVQIDGAYGVVKTLGLRSLELVTPDDTVVTIPHLKIWQPNVFNSNAGQRELLCVADFYLHPRHDADRVGEKLLDVARTSPFLHMEKPVAVVAAEKPWWTHYRLKAYPVDARDQFQFTTDLTLRGKAALAQLGAAPAVGMFPLPAESPDPLPGANHFR